MLSPRQLQSVGETMTHRQAAGLALRLFLIWPSFILAWVSVAAVIIALIEAVVGRGAILAGDEATFSFLWTFLAYGLSFTGALWFYRSTFFRAHPVLGSIMGFLSMIPAIWVMQIIRPALRALGID